MVGTGVNTGLLSTDTTKRPGIVVNTDISPTILHFFGVNQDSSMLGSAISSISYPSPIVVLQSMNKQMVATENAMTPILAGYVFVITFTMIAYVILLIAASFSVQRARSILKSGCLRPVLFALLLAPLAILVAPGFGIYDTFGSASFIVVSSLAIALILNRVISDQRLTFACIGIVTTLTICIDLLVGAPLQHKAILSYSAIDGARFYGIGNEYSGVLLGAVFLGIFSLADLVRVRLRSRTLWVLLAYVAIMVVIGTPRFGAKFGAMPAAVVGFSYAIVKLQDEHRKRQAMFWVCIIDTILLFSMLAMNAISNQSHVGHVYWHARQSGMSVIWETALRKWDMNYKLIRYSRWAIVLESLIFGLIVLSYRPVQAVRAVLSKHRAVNAGFVGILTSTITGLLTNDSGVVLAAIGLLYLAFPLILMVESERDTLFESSIEDDPGRDAGS